MSAPQNAILPAGFVNPPPASFTAGNGTAAKILVDLLPAAAATGNNPAYYGGCSVIDLLAVSSDTAAKDVLLFIGSLATTQGTTATGAMATTAGTVTRASGSFIADGYQVGDQIMIFAPFGAAANSGVDGIQATVTGVAALTLTVNGSPFGVLALAAGSRVFRTMPRLRQTVAIAAGSNGTTSSQGLLGVSTDGSKISTEIKLGPNNVLIGGMQSAVSALPCVVSINPVIALY